MLQINIDLLCANRHLKLKLLHFTQEKYYLRKIDGSYEGAHLR